MSKIIKNTSFYTIGNILPQAVGFFLLPIYTHYLTPSDYGIISSLQVLTSILNIFFTLAIDRSVFRMYFDYKTETGKKDYLGTITIALVSVSSAMLILIFLFRGVVGEIYKSIEFYPYYTFAILSVFFAIFQIIPKIYFQVNEQANKFVLISLAQFLLNVGFCIWFVVQKKEGPSGMLKGELFANVILTPLVIYITYKTINFKFKSKIFLESLKFSIPLIPGLLSAFVLNLSDRIFIERYFTLADVGIYSLGYKIAGLTGVVSSSFLLAYGPVFYKHANSEDQVAAKEKIYNYNYIYIMIVIIISFMITLFSKEAIIILLDPKYRNSYKIIPIIALSYLIMEITSVFNMMIYQNKKSVALMTIILFSACFSIVINFILIPVYGAYGAAFATLISFIIVLILTWRYAQKCYYVPINWKPIILLIFSLIIIYYIFEFTFAFNLVTTIILKILTASLILFFIRNHLLKLKNILHISL